MENKILMIAAILATSILTFNCGGKKTDKEKEDENGFIIKKENDLTKLNLKGKVKELREKEERSGIISYIKFNEAGYITEKGHKNRDFRNNGITEVMQYDENNNLTEHAVYESPYDYDIFIYDNTGNLIEKQYYRKNYQLQQAQKERFEKFRYENVGERKLNIYRNDVLYSNIEYDKYKNELVNNAYNSSGELERRFKYEYEYDNNGKIIVKKEYYPQLPPFEVEEPVKNETWFIYDENGNLVSRKIVHHLDLMENDKKDKRITTRAYEEKHEWVYDANNNILSNGTYHLQYEYDYMRNWILKRNEITYKTEATREYDYYNETSGQQTDMIISLSELNPCDGSSFILYIHGGTPFNGAQPYKIRAYNKEHNIELELYINEFNKNSDGIYSVSFVQNGGTDIKYILEVEDSKRQKKEQSFEPVYCG